MRPDRPPRLVLSTIAALALLASACGAATRPSDTPAHPSTPQPQAATTPDLTVRGALLAVGRTGQPGLEVIESDRQEPAMTMPIGIPDSAWAHFVTVVPDGAATIVRNHPFGENTGPELRLEGRWRLPTLGQDPLPVGRSLDDSTIVLVEDRDVAYGATAVSRFAVLRSSVPAASGSGGQLQLAQTIELHGAFEFDALSPDGSILYLVEHLDPGNGGRYQVRSMTVGASRLDETAITDKRFIDEPMAGVPITQLRRTDGRVMTLYRGDEHPFVHALNSLDRWAFCIDLPANGANDANAALDWGLAESRDGRTVYAVNATLGLVVDIDPGELSVRRSARIETSNAAAAPAIVLAKFGHEDSGPVGRRVVVTPDGGTILAGGRDGLVAIDGKALTRTWRALEGEAVRGLALTRDGSTVFALLGSGRIVAVSTADGSTQGFVPGEDFDRLVAITG